MFTNITLILLLIAALIIFAFIWWGRTGKKNVFAFLHKPKVNPALQFSHLSASGFPEHLIDRPMDYNNDEETITIDKQGLAEEAKLEMIDDAESLLLKAAEIVVEKVQQVVDHLSSRPTDSNEVLSRIKNIVSQYRIFQNTDYFEPINSFIAITVERDCGIQLKKEELMQIWV